MTMMMINSSCCDDDDDDDDDDQPILLRLGFDYTSHPSFGEATRRVLEKRRRERDVDLGVLGPKILFQGNLLLQPMSLDEIMLPDLNDCLVHFSFFSERKARNNREGFVRAVVPLCSALCFK
ncbi:hypothetical protein Sjap_010938 [Stephania japonica]|uniref:Uncharacterized protein n=1 Tax=Stephania japonica TaxID=461633 RepID=A0AAP0P7M1_9MAGN